MIIIKKINKNFKNNKDDNLNLSLLKIIIILFWFLNFIILPNKITIINYK